ncbi:MAG: V-type ATP synthase subunit F [Aerococcus sp.]|nr:V-type ATP synthase subunit F [Aerococcus sp.]
MKAKIGVVGEANAVFPFKLLNFTTFAVESAAEARRQIRTLADDEYGIIYLTETIAAEIPDVLDYYESQTLPAIILIPSLKGSTGLASQRLRGTVERAVGQDILD